MKPYVFGSTAPSSALARRWSASALWGAPRRWTSRPGAKLWRTAQRPRAEAFRSDGWRRDRAEPVCSLGNVVLSLLSGDVHLRQDRTFVELSFQKNNLYISVYIYIIYILHVARRLAKLQLAHWFQDQCSPHFEPQPAARLSTRVGFFRCVAVN